MGSKILRTIYLFCLIISPFAAFAQPTANFTATPLTGCAPLLVQFTSTSTGSPTNYSWNFGNSASSALQNPSTTYTTPGTYTVTLTVSNSSGTNTKTVTNYITVLGKPIVNFATLDTAGCPPHTAVFTNTTDPVVPGTATYNWNFGDGYGSTQATPTHTYAAPGYYNVTLVCTNAGGCNASLTKAGYVHVLQPPIVDFTALPNSYCDAPATINFVSSIVGTGPYTINWNFGDATSGTGANPTHIYVNPGSYTVTMVVTDARGCKDTMTKVNYVTIGNLAPSFTMNPTSGCVNTPVTFTNTSLGGNNLTWLFGDGGTATTTQNTVTHVYGTAGTFNVSLIVQNGVCIDTVTVPITINPQPDANYSFTPLHPCPAPSTVQFTNTSTGASTYTWIFDDGGQSTATSPSHTYNQNGWYTVQLIATSSAGCKDTVLYTDSLRIYPLMADIGAVPGQGCAPLTVNFVSTNFTNLPSNGSLYPYPTATYHWDFGNSQTSTSPTPSTTYSVAGTYTVVLTVTTVDGCVDKDTVFVNVGNPPTAQFHVVDDTVCNHEEVQFINTSTGATSFIWDFGDGGATGAQQPVYEYSAAGTYTVTLHAFNNGCEDTFQVVDLITVFPPTSKWTAIYDCDTPRMVRFYDTASVEPTSLLWWFGDGQTSTQSNPVHTYAATGNYYVSLITYNNIYGCTDTLTNMIQIIDPSAYLVTNDTAICKGDSLYFTSSYTSTATEYNWMIGGPGYYQDTTANIGYRFNTTGWYTIAVSIRDMHGCYDTFKRNNYVIVAKPTPAFIATPTVGCVPLNVLFTDQSTDVTGATIVSRYWDFGNGNTTTVAGPTANSTYLAAGTYDVWLVVTDNIGCFDTLKKPDYVEARQPVAAFTVNDTAACIGQVLNFSNSSQGAFLQAAWTFGDGQSSNVFGATHAYANTGTYTVRLIVTDASGCKDTMERVAYINISKPDASFTMSDTLAICPPLQVIFTNTTIGGNTYTWDFGNGGASTLPSPSEIYTDPGILNITMIASNSQGCKDTAYGSVNVMGYAGGLVYTPLSGCAPLDVQFTATLNNVPSIIWDFSDGVTMPATSNSITHTYETPGAYIPKLILSDGQGCLNSSAGIDTIKVDGVLAGFINTPACVSTPVNFTDTSFSFFSPVTNWQWNINNGQQTAATATTSYTYNTTGSYQVVLIATNANGCSDTVTRTVNINPLPVITALPDTSVCNGDQATLSADGGVSYAWTPAATVACATCQTTQATPTAPTTYVVTGTDANGCQNTADIQVAIQFLTTFVPGPGGQICDDSSFQLMASGAHHYEWKPAASLDNALIPNPMASPHATTNYTVIAWEGSCPPDSSHVEVVVWPLPVINAGSDETIVAGGSVMLNAVGSNTQQYVWSPTETLSCEFCTNPTATPPITTQYKVIAISSHGCKSSDSVTVKVICDQSQVFVPNLFSPNGDGNNDVFFPRGVGLKEVKSFRIYNRWGELVYEQRGMGLNDESRGWNGTYKGAELAPDVFVYSIEATCENGSDISWKGDITLIR